MIANAAWVPAISIPSKPHRRWAAGGPSGHRQALVDGLLLRLARLMESVSRGRRTPQ